MRKKLVLFLILLVMVGAGAAYCVMMIHKPLDMVSYREHTLYGDKSYADGLVYNKRDYLLDHAMWTDEIRFTKDAMKVNTEYEYSNKDLSYLVDIENSDSGDYLYLSNSMYFNGDSGDYDTADAGVKKLLTEMEAETLAGESKSKTIHLKDYMEYYTINIEMNIPGLSYVTAMDTCILPASDEYVEAVGMIRDFFRIPVLESEVYEVTMDKDEDGNVIYAEVNMADNQDHFILGTYSMISDDACIFWFDNYFSDRGPIDTSEIPGGYGVYVLPFTMDPATSESTLHAEDLKVFYPVNANQRILNVDLTKDQNNLLVHIAEDGRYKIAILDVKNGDLKQKIDLCAYDEDYYYESLADADHDLQYCMIAANYNSFYCIKKKTYGKWEVAIRSEKQFQDAEFEGFAVSYISAYDGERLALINYDWGRDEKERWSFGCDFNLQIFDHSGLVYAGSYESSLEDANQVKNESGYYVDPIQKVEGADRLSWGEIE